MRLLEREPHLELLDSLLGQARGGEGRVALVFGEAGIGKTSLLQAFAAAHPDLRILWGGCEALFTPHPLAPLHDIARQAGGGFAEAITAAASRHEIFNTAFERLARLPTPVVAVVEDAHWADEATLDFIKFLGRRLQRIGMLLLVSYRDDEVSDKHPLRSVIGDLPHKAVSRIRLPPLSETAVGMLAKAAGRPATGLHELTGGNAFFITELLATSQEQVPATVRDAAMARIARLSPEARRIAHLASIIPGKAERWLMEAASAPGGASAVTLQECLAAGMVAFPDHSLGFRHELARRAVEDSVPVPQRQDLHAEVLAALLGRGEGQVAVGRLVHHAAQAADSAAVLRFAPAAAEQAAAMGAHRNAAGYLRVALQYSTALDSERRALLFDRLSYECHLMDQIPEATAAREAALALWRSLGDRVREGDDLRWLSRLAWFSGQKAAAEAYARQAIELLETLPPCRELAMAYSNLALLHMLANESSETQRWGRKALELATSLGEPEIQTHALNNMGAAKLSLDDADGYAYLEQALEIALKHDFEEHVARAYVNLIGSPGKRINLTYVNKYLQTGIAYCEEHDLDSWGRYLVAHRAEVALSRGRWDDAAADAEAVVRNANAPPIRIQGLVALGQLRARRGDPDWESPLTEAYRLAVPTSELQRLGPVMVARSEAAWLHGGADAELLAALAGTYAASLKLGERWICAELASWMWRHGSLEQVPPGIPTQFVLQIAGDWREAARIWEQFGCPYEEAMALADSDEEAALRKALEICEKLGANPLAARVKRKLRASGVRGIPRGSHGSTRQNPAGLTNREIKVLALVAEGQRNADIARRLFLSEKTVGHHVSSVLAKLGAKSRGEAVATAARLGLVLPPEPNK